MSFGILEKSKYHLLYEVTPGKPDSQETKREGKDQRGRVYQSNLKGPNCTYYTFNYLRERIGKKFDASFQDQRNIEVICSERRKNITNLYKFYYVQEGEEQEESSEYIAKYKELSKLYYETVGEKVPFPVFLQSMVLKDLLDIDTQFLHSMKADTKVVEEMLEVIKADSNYKLKCHGSLMNGYANYIQAKAYGLIEASWTPQSTIEELIAELDTGGPIALMGSIGKCMYQEEPKVMKQKIEGRNIYYWSPGSPKNNKRDLHIVLVIGAKKHEGKGYVYYIDCNDPSNPENKETQKIYIISYANLCENATTIMALKTVEHNGQQMFPYGFQSNTHSHL